MQGESNEKTTEISAGEGSSREMDCTAIHTPLKCFVSKYRS